MHKRLLSGRCGPVESHIISECVVLLLRKKTQACLGLLHGQHESHLPSACICIHFNAHTEWEHVFSGNHGKVNYTDSIRDLMIYGAQYTPADDRSWARQLKMAEEE
jgi:hypothetical protein